MTPKMIRYNLQDPTWLVRMGMHLQPTRTTTSATTTLWTLLTSNSKRCILRAARTTSTSAKRARKPLGKTYGRPGKGCSDSYTVKMNTKRYLIWSFDLTGSSRPAWSTLRSFGCTSTNQSITILRQDSSNSTGYGKICTMSAFWRISSSSTSWMTCLNNTTDCKHTTKSRFPRVPIDTFLTKSTRIWWSWRQI